MGNEHTNGYAEVNGLRIYYEVHGTDRPLLLLHGGHPHARLAALGDDAR